MKVHATAGCPQGGVLSPILWCMVMDSLLVRLTALGIPCIGYADDGVIVVRGKHGKTVSDIMNNALLEVARWCFKSGLSVNPSKISYVAFTRKRQLDLGNVYYLDHKLELTEKVKFLGVYFDSKLNWGLQLEYCTNRARKIFWSCRNAIGRTWGLSPKIVYWIYSMIISPIITYGAIVWWSRTRLSSARSNLNRLQRMVCVALSGCLRTTPTAALESLLGLLPLNLRIEVEAQTGVKRLMYLGLWKENSKHLSWGHLVSQVKDLSSFIMPSDFMSLRYAFHKPFKIHFPTRDEWFNSPRWLKGKCLIWYTDGSKIGAKSGAGIYCSNDGTKLHFPLGNYATVFQAEVYAIILCCKLCIDKGYQNTTIRICSDSQAALLSLSRCKFTSLLVWECFSVLCDLSTHNKVSLHWVPGHMGIGGNELADEAARAGSNAIFWGPEPALGISPSSFRATIFKLYGKIAHEQWRAADGQRQAKELNRDCPSVRQKELLKLNRNSIRKIIGLLTGHCILRRHLNIMGIESNSLCRGCHLEEETSRHILCDCEVYSAQRFEHLGQHCVNAWELQDVPVRCLLNFISAIGLSC
nr:uncharacterized protein LOC122270622 [Parasteatoda tepidariorum]